MQKRRYLLDDLGIDGFKTDGGEHLQGRSITASDNRRGDELVNAFPNLYIGAYYRFANERRRQPGPRSFLAATASSLRSTWTRPARCVSNFRPCRSPQLCC